MMMDHSPAAPTGCWPPWPTQAATATFFILVGRARRFPSLLADVVAAGHEIALHGVDHVRLTTMSPAMVRKRTRDGRRELEDLAGQQVRWFRPPYGAQRPSTWAAIRSTGLVSVVWSNEAADWQDDTVDEITARTASVRSGSVLLLHDGYADASDGVDDGPPPGFDRGELSRRILGELGSGGWLRLRCGMRWRRGLLCGGRGFGSRRLSGCSVGRWFRFLVLGWCLRSLVLECSTSCWRVKGAARRCAMASPPWTRQHDVKCG